MNKQNILTIVLLLITISVYAQPLELDIHKNRLADFIKIEQNVGSERIKNKTNYISKQGVTHPIQFRRKENIIPDLLCSYFYFTNDSTIDYVHYEWDESNFGEHDENFKIPQNEISAFIEKYKELYNYIFKSYGKSKREGSLNKLRKIDEGDFGREDTWTPNDSTEIEMSIDLSNKFEKKGAMTIVPAYRIGLYIRNISKSTNENTTAKLDKNKINELNAVLKTFLTELQNKNIEKIKFYLSDKISKTVTEDQIDNLRQKLKFDDSLIVYFSGIQTNLLDGSSYLMLQYKYKSDLNNPPEELLKVMFDDKNKILGIQPSKRL